MLWTSILATDLLGLAAGAWLLWGGGRASEPSWSADARRWIGLGLGLGVLTLLAGLALDGGFLVLRLWCHVLFCVLVPLLVARALQRRGALGAVLVVLGLTAEGAYVWARRIEPFRLQVTRHEITSARLAGARALRIVVLADLQTDDVGAFEERVFRRIDEERADLVLLPGDLVQLGRGAGESAARVQAELSALFGGLRHRPPLGFLMVGGDCDPRGAGLEEAGVRMLRDEAAQFPEQRLQVIGLTLAASRRALELHLLAAAREFEGLTLVLGHAPDFALSALEADVPLVCIAGHTHGGQVVLPFFGPLITLSRVPRRMAAGGLFPLGDSWLCVSRGIGMERDYAPQIRFLCPPELVVLELSAGAPAGRSVARAERED